ncbi:pyruvate carboxylase subunit B [bacterium]|nr:pyruvate carboxylase subunit B [bacterium]MBU1024716.1 pyruvate carboxylase subunit B [bacterium]
MKKKPVKICDTTLRDGHQSLIATRMRTDDMLPIAAKIDDIGYHSVEMWGGATFDSAMRFLNENPWDRVRKLKEIMPKTPFQMLLRAQNIVGYKHYPDDILEKFVYLSKEAGIDIFRIFDALNDLRNMEAAMKFVKKAGGHVQASFSYTISPVHTIEKYVEMAQGLKDMGADSICIKDMAGMITPYAAFELVSGLKSKVGLPVQFHTHSTSGMETAAALKAIEAGADIIDTAISSMAGTTSQPATEPIVATLIDTEYDTGLDLTKLAVISAYFSEVRKKYCHFESGINSVDVRVLQYQVPGGMLSNLMSQLREQGAEKHYEAVLAEVPRVRKELGYPPLVTPSSQIVGTQATLNVVMGKRYKVIPEEVKNYVRGYYGKPPAEIDPEIQKLIIGNEKPITCRPADKLKPGLKKAQKEIKNLARNEEDVMSYALFPQVAKKFLERREHGIDESFGKVAAIAARIALDTESKNNNKNGAEHPKYVISPWKLTWRPHGRWTGLQQ